MKSTIKIDFAGLDNNDSFQPVIRVHLQDSDDVRDGLLKSFFQSLGGESNWLMVNFHNDTFGDETQRITIYPVRPSELKENANLMLNRAVSNGSDKI